MNDLLTLNFEQADLLDRLMEADEADLDALDFGIIGIDDQTLVRRYNACEAKMAGLSPQRVLDQPLFTAVAPCMNNYLVAQRFEDAVAEGSLLDVQIDYVFTLRMRPVKVKLRLLARPGADLRYVIVRRPT